MDKNIDVKVDLTDKSLNASSWYWELSDGQKSLEQNPSFTINTASNIDVSLVVTSESGCQDISSQTIGIITGLDSDIMSRSFSYYPNPANQEIMIELTNEFMGRYEVTILNTLGKRIDEYFLVKNSESIKQSIPVNHIPRGVYLMKVGQEGIGYVVVRIIKN